MFIGSVVFIIVVNAGNAVFTILAVDASSTGFRLDDRRGFAVCTILAFRTDKADGTIFTIFAIMAKDDIIRAAIQSIMKSRIDRAARDKAGIVFCHCATIVNIDGTIRSSRRQMLAEIDVDAIRIDCDARSAYSGYRLIVAKGDAMAFLIGNASNLFFELLDVDGIGIVFTGFHIGNGRAALTSQRELRLIDSCAARDRVVLDSTAAHLAELRIESRQVLGRSLARLDIGAIRGRTDFLIDGVARYQLLGAVGICICNTHIGIGNTACAKGIAPSVFVGCDFFLLGFIRRGIRAEFREVPSDIIGTDIHLAAQVNGLPTSSRKLSILNRIINGATSNEAVIVRHNLSFLDIDHIRRGIAILLGRDCRESAIDNFDRIFGQIADDSLTFSGDIVHISIGFIRQGRIDRATRDELLGAVGQWVIRSRFHRIRNHAGTDSGTPGILVGCLIGIRDG